MPSPVGDRDLCFVTCLSAQNTLELCNLSLKVFDEDVMSDECIGTVIIRLSSYWALLSSNHEVPLTLQLDTQGEVSVVLSLSDIKPPGVTTIRSTEKFERHGEPFTVELSTGSVARRVRADGAAALFSKSLRRDWCACYGTCGLVCVYVGA